jgi:protein TonB
MLKFFLLAISLLFSAMQMRAQQTDSATTAMLATRLLSVDQMPDFPGGNKALLKYLSENLEYPEAARKNGIEGKVLSQFIVNEDGTLTDVEIIRRVGYGCDEEVLRLIHQMPRWNAGKEDGKVVKVLFKVPVVFALGE